MECMESYGNMEESNWTLQTSQDWHRPHQYLGVNGKNYYAKPWGNDSSNIQAPQESSRFAKIILLNLCKLYLF